MKLQNLTVIFIIIIIPIILVLSLYISTGIKTIKYQSLYDDGLLTATHDAVYAYELNSANNEFSENPETKRSIIKSSVKMFETSLSNACGISSYSSDEIEEYVPAVVFGMYDGFYMYAPSGLYNSTTGKVEDYAHNLKNYVYYSETLKNSNGDVIITYSLDNYITVSGDFGEGYEVKKGYLMKIDTSKVAQSVGEEYDGIEIVTEEINGEINTEAKEYYKAAFSFTHWFLNESGLKNVETNDGLNPFDLGNSNDPENEKSAFVQHKRKIIKEKLESVLNSTITAYSNRTWGKSYKMPKLSEDDWQKIYNNISMITFFQGKKMGLTNYNGYCVVNCTNTEEYVNPNLMYFTDEEGYYHNILCEKCKNYNIEDSKSKVNGYKIGSFEKKQIDVIPEGATEPKKEYTYDHDELACYECINGTSTTNKENVYEYISNSNNDDLKSIYWTSLGRERYDSTKITPIDVEIDVNFDANEGTGDERLQKYNIKYNYGAEIHFPNIEDNPQKTGHIFNGWSTTKDGQNPVEEGSQIATVDITYYASWKRDTYRVIFNYNNEDDIDNSYKEEEELEFDKLITFPMDPPEDGKKEGYKLIGWNTESTATIGTTGERVKAYDDQIYYGIWEINKYEIKFDYNYDGKGLIGEPVTLEYNKFITFPSLEREGYDLVGWSTNSTATSGIKTAQAKENTTYYAIWKIKEFDITFKHNDGTDNETIETYEYASTIVFPTITREGYTLKGWSTDTTEENIVTTTVTVKGKQTYYAIWKPNTYTVKYEGNGAEVGNTANSIHTYDVSSNLTANGFTKTGYKFDGWATSADGEKIYSDKQNVKNLTSVDGATVTLYAKWKAITYTIQYEGNGNTGGSTLSSTHTYNEERALNQNGFIRTGYTFEGWATSPSGEKVYSDRQNVINLTNVDGATITLYAIWQVNIYTVVYNGNGSTGGSTASTIHTYDTERPLNQNGFTRTGYTFDGWATSAGGSKRYSDNEMVSNLTAENQATVNLYAVWKANIYTITCDRQSGSGGTGTLYEKYNTGYYSNSTATASINSITRPTRTGYTFEGYYTGANGSGAQVINQSGTIVAANTLFTNNATIYAKWEPTIYTITCNTQSGTGGTGTFYEKYNTGYYSNSTATTSINSITRPTRTDYTFKGYYTGTNGSGTQVIDESGNIKTSNTAFTSNTNVYAYWIENNCSITYKRNFSSSDNTTLNLNPNIAAKGDQVTLPTTSRTNYNFKGWSTSRTGTPVSSITITGNTTLYAIWEFKSLKQKDGNQAVKLSFDDSEKEESNCSYYPYKGLFGITRYYSCVYGQLQVEIDPNLAENCTNYKVEFYFESNDQHSDYLEFNWSYYPYEFSVNLNAENSYKAATRVNHWCSAGGFEKDYRGTMTVYGTDLNGVEHNLGSKTVYVYANTSATSFFEPDLSFNGSGINPDKEETFYY